MSVTTSTGKRLSFSQISNMDTQSQPSHTCLANLILSFVFKMGTRVSIIYHECAHSPAILGRTHSWRDENEENRCANAHSPNPAVVAQNSPIMQSTAHISTQIDMQSQSDLATSHYYANLNQSLVTFTQHVNALLSTITDDLNRCQTNCDILEKKIESSQHG